MAYIINDILTGKNVIAIGNKGSGKTKLALSLAIDISSQTPNSIISVFSKPLTMSNILRHDIVEYMSFYGLTATTNDTNQIKFSNGTIVRFLTNSSEIKGVASDYIIFDDIDPKYIDDILSTTIPSDSKYVLILDESDLKYYENKYITPDLDLNFFKPMRKDCVIYDIRD